MTNEKQLSIRLHGSEVGILEQLPSGNMKFTYNESATQAISYRLPIRKESYPHLDCEAFFGGLLPENPHARKMIGKEYHVSANNSFALLKAIGHDCAGAISCHSLDDPTQNKKIFRLKEKFFLKMNFTNILLNYHKNLYFSRLKDCVYHSPACKIKLLFV